MSKNKQDKTEKRLQKIIDSGTDFLPMLTSPRIFTFIEHLCRKHLEENKYDEPSKSFIAGFAFSMRQEAMAKLGHDSLETLMIAKLLMTGPTAGFIDKAPRLDSITWINRYPAKHARLSAEQEEAAEFIKSIWDGFGKFLWISGRSFGGGGGSRSSAAQPIDVMSEELWQHHQTIYSPWHKVASRIAVDRRTAGGDLTIAAITFKILIEDYYPEQVDGAYGLMAGKALKALKFGLDGYWNPLLLAIPVPEPRGGARAGAGRPTSVAGGRSAAGHSKEPEKG